MTGVAADRGNFGQLADRFRPELLAHCCRILGSAHEAEDLVQETYLRAWRSLDEFEGRASLRNWLYRIATNTCLNAIEARSRRPLPTGLGGPADPAADQHGQESAWLEPIARVLFGSEPADPAAVIETRTSVRLALTVAWRCLTPRQRAVLLLCEVLGWRAGEVAELLGTSSAAVYSMLQRARAQLTKAAGPADQVDEPDDPHERDLLDRYVAAFEHADLPALMNLLTSDAVCEVPPEPIGLAGREAIARFMATECPAFGTCQMVRTTHQGKPAFATYLRGEDGIHRAYSVEALTITSRGIARIVSHQRPELFHSLGLPLVRHSPSAR
ncbi:RNA polymerase subunit sigma-70 [Streptosporangium sp. G11]|uniref:RNA polymerase subunit sigma-70 n=1 Tax=Streptosporangium sp. G11 TaxID=3436926 RepID=UPI003EBF0149